MSQKSIRRKPWRKTLFSWLAMGAWMTVPADIERPAGASKCRDQVIGKIEERAKESSTDFLFLGDHKNIFAEVGLSKLDSLFDVRSITKSVTGVLLAKLLEREHLCPCFTMASLLEEWRISERGMITLQDIYLHRSGIVNKGGRDEWAETERDSLASSLSGQMTFTPGTVFHYNNTAINVFPRVIERQTKIEFQSIIQDEVLSVIGVDPKQWRRDQKGSLICSSGLLMTPRQLLTLGAEMLPSGQLQGISSASTERRHLGGRLAETKARPFPYPFWFKYETSAVSPVSVLYAHGWGGQFLLLAPEAGVVGVRLRETRNDSRKETEFNDFVELFVEFVRAKA